MGGEVAIPGRHGDRERADMFASLVTLAVAVVTFEHHLIVDGVALFRQFIDADFHTVAVIFHFNAFLIQGDNGICGYRFNSGGRQSHEGKAKGHDQ